MANAVRIKHLGSGITVTRSDFETEALNRTAALKEMSEKLWEWGRKEADAVAEKLKASFGSQIRTYTLDRYQLVKDERTDYQTSDTEAVLDGDLDALVQAYLVHNRS